MGHMTKEILKINADVRRSLKCSVYLRSFKLCGKDCIGLITNWWSNALQKFLKINNVWKNMKIFYDISNLLTTFQMSYIYHQVAILAYKILIKKHVDYKYTIRE